MKMGFETTNTQNFTRNPMEYLPDPKTPSKKIKKTGILGFRGLTPYFALLSLKGPRAPRGP